MSLDKPASGAQRVRKIDGAFIQQVLLLKRWARIVLCGLVTTTAGCGTLVERGESSKVYSRSGDYYVGVQYDWKLLSLEGKGGYDYIPMFCYLSIVCPFVTLLSMPVDFVVDTAMLYSDHQARIIEEQKYNKHLSDKYCFVEGGPDEAALKKSGLDVGVCVGAGDQSS